MRLPKMIRGESFTSQFVAAPTIKLAEASRLANRDGRVDRHLLGLMCMELMLASARGSVVTHDTVWFEAIQSR